MRTSSLVLAATLLLAAGPRAGEARGGWTVAGSAATNDGFTGVPGVTVTLYPDGVKTVTDEDGIFMLPWSGQQGHLTLIPQERSLEGKEWCLRVRLMPKAPASADSIHDVGVVPVIPSLTLLDPPAPTLPDGSAPPPIRAPGPADRDSARFELRVRVGVDPWGRAGHVEAVDGAERPEELRSRLLQWLRETDWKVAPFTRCGEDLPFRLVTNFAYAWAESLWVPVDTDAAR